MMDVVLRCYLGPVVATDVFLFFFLSRTAKSDLPGQLNAGSTREGRWVF